MTRKEMVLRRGRLGICGLVRVPAVPVSRDLPEAGEYAPFRSGLFRPLRSPAYEGPWSVRGCLLRRRTKEEKYLMGVPLVMKGASAWFLVFA